MEFSFSKCAAFEGKVLVAEAELASVNFNIGLTLEVCGPGAGRIAREMQQGKNYTFVLSHAYDGRTTKLEIFDCHLSQGNRIVSAPAKPGETAFLWTVEDEDVAEANNIMESIRQIVGRF